MADSPITPENRGYERPDSGDGDSASYYAGEFRQAAARTPAADQAAESVWDREHPSIAQYSDVTSPDSAGPERHEEDDRHSLPVAESAVEPAGAGDEQEVGRERIDTTGFTYEADDLHTGARVSEPRLDQGGVSSDTGSVDSIDPGQVADAAGSHETDDRDRTDGEFDEEDDVSWKDAASWQDPESWHRSFLNMPNTSDTEHPTDSDGNQVGANGVETRWGSLRILKVTDRRRVGFNGELMNAGQASSANERNTMDPENDGSDRWSVPTITRQVSRSEQEFGRLGGSGETRHEYESDRGVTERDFLGAENITGFFAATAETAGRSAQEQRNRLDRSEAAVTALTQAGVRYDALDPDSRDSAEGIRAQQVLIAALREDADANAALLLPDAQPSGEAPGDTVSDRDCDEDGLTPYEISWDLEHRAEEGDQYERRQREFIDKEQERRWARKSRQDAIRAKDRLQNQ